MILFTFYMFSDCLRKSKIRDCRHLSIRCSNRISNWSVSCSKDDSYITTNQISYQEDCQYSC
jgi:hypothetical protein